jgi:hypothetical protein
MSPRPQAASMTLHNISLTITMLSARALFVVGCSACLASHLLALQLSARLHVTIPDVYLTYDTCLPKLGKLDSRGVPVLPNHVLGSTQIHSKHQQPARKTLCRRARIHVAADWEADVDRFVDSCLKKCCAMRLLVMWRTLPCTTMDAPMSSRYGRECYIVIIVGTN